MCPRIILPCREIVVRADATRNSRLLHRILHRFFKVGFTDLQIVLAGDERAVAYPLTDNVSGELFLQFRLSA